MNVSMLPTTLPRPVRARLLLRRVAGFVLFLLFAAQAAAVLGETLGAGHEDVASHSEGTPGHEDPCGSSCPCACCPGQSVTKALCSFAPLLHIAALQVLLPIAVIDLHPADTAVGIFHPPRA